MLQALCVSAAMNKSTYVTDFTTGSVARQLLWFALPMLLSQLLQITYNMADMIIVGQVLGKAGLSAVSIGGDLTNCLTFIAMGFSNAGQILISQYIGARRHDQLAALVSTLLLLLLFFALLMTAGCLYERHAIMALMNTPPEAYGETMGYAVVSMTGILFIYGYNAASAILRGMGDARHPFYFIACATVLNVILDLVFVCFWNLGAAGAALATVFSQGVSFLAASCFIWRHRSQYYLPASLGEFFHPDFQIAGDLLKLGVPMAIKNASVQFSKLFVNSWINSYGVAVSAFSGVANRLYVTSNLISNAINTAGSSMIGQNIGAARYERVNQIIWSIFRITVTLAILFSILLYTWPVEIFQIFTDDPEVARIGLEYVPIGILCFFSCAGRSAMNSLINGSGNTKVNFATALFDGLILRLGLSVLFGVYLNMRYMGFWLGDALANFTPFWVGSLFYLSGAWKKSRVRQK